MKRLVILCALCSTLLLVGLALAQSPEPSFAQIRSIGQPRPRGLQYEPHYDQIAWVDPLGKFQLVDARTFTVQHTLYDTGFYNAYQFSHNGRYLALAIDTRFEIYDTSSGELLLAFTPDGSLRAEGPLYWSADDTLLGVNLQVRAPQAIRQSENDTVNLPYVWDIAAELGERRTILPGARAIPFFDYRNGFVYGPNNKAIVGLPERLQILDITSAGVNVIDEIPASRFERDPIYAWKSLRDEFMYLRPNNAADVIQFDTKTANSVPFFIGRDVTAYSFDDLDGLQLSHLSRRIGDPLATQENSLLRFLLGNDYRAQFGYHPITVTLVDYLEPATPTTGDRVAVLLYIFDETRGVGRFDLIDFYPAAGFSLSQDGNLIAIRRESIDARIDVFEISTGNLVQTFAPAMPEVAGAGIFSFDESGRTIISDFQRFDVATGEIVFENLHYNNGYDQFFWNEGSDKLVTVTGNRWWVWDIFTGEVIRQETLALGETIIGTATDGGRYLLDLPEDQVPAGAGDTYEMVEVGTDDRGRVNFDKLPNVVIENIIFSPNGENYIVIYSTNPRGQHAPGNEIMLYNLDAGLLWHLAGDDLPYMTARQYGWVDDETVYIYSEEDSAAPERIYGVTYHSSGVPQCLVDVFPTKINDWSLIWERLNYSLPSDALNKLAKATCELLPTEEEEVVDFIFPSPTPTRLPVTATPSTIAGVPLCLTSRFPNEARDYAVIWEELTAGRTETEIEELELLLCENLTGSAAPQAEAALVTNNVKVMTIDLESGWREVGAFIPKRDEVLPPNLDLINRNFRQQYGFTPNGELSPDQNLYAVWSQRNQVNIYRLLTPYTSYAADATATVAFVEQQEEDVSFLSLRPTATQDFQYLGQPRPTFTPTITPTAPPRPEGDLYLRQEGEVERMCPYDARFTIADSPPDFAATGRIMAWGVVDDLRVARWVLDAATGDWTLDDTLPKCYMDGNCGISFDGEWLYTYQDEPRDFIVARPDGSQQRNYLLENNILIDNLQGAVWQGLHTLVYQLTLPPSTERRNAQTITQQLDPEAGTITDIPNYETRASYNQLPTEILTTQPGVNSRYQVVSVVFSTEAGEGNRYFIYDREQDLYLYIGRVAENSGSMQFQWHPLGHTLYYSYPDDELTYAFFPEYEIFMPFGTFHSGIWSRDGRSTVYTISLPLEEREDLIDAESPVPNLEIWSAETGLRQQYCVPGFERGDLDTRFIWSPDDRYVAFQATLPDDTKFSLPPRRTFILDTLTGSVTEISDQAGDIIIWMKEVYP